MSAKHSAKKRNGDGLKSEPISSSDEDKPIEFPQKRRAMNRAAERAQMPAVRDKLPDDASGDDDKPIKFLKERRAMDKLAERAQMPVVRGGAAFESAMALDNGARRRPASRTKPRHEPG